MPKRKPAVIEESPTIPRTAQMAAPSFDREKERKALQTWWPPFSLVGYRFGHFAQLSYSCSHQCGIAKAHPSTFEQFVADVLIADSITKLTEWTHHYAWNMVYVVDQDSPETGYRCYNMGFRKFDATGLSAPPITMGAEECLPIVKRLFDSGKAIVLFYDAEHDRSIQLWPAVPGTPWEQDMRQHEEPIGAKLAARIRLARKNRRILAW